MGKRIVSAYAIGGLHHIVLDNGAIYAYDQQTRQWMLMIPAFFKDEGKKKQD